MWWMKTSYGRIWVCGKGSYVWGVRGSCVQTSSTAYRHDFAWKMENAAHDKRLLWAPWAGSRQKAICRLTFVVSPLPRWTRSKHFAESISAFVEWIRLTTFYRFPVVPSITQPAADIRFGLLMPKPNSILSSKQSPKKNKSRTEVFASAAARLINYFDAEHRGRTQFWRGFVLLAPVQHERLFLLMPRRVHARRLLAWRHCRGAASNL
jgi:hypothetical protein